MKKVIIIAITALLLTIFAGCRRVSHNGAIDGHWVITAIETTADGSVRHPRSFTVNIQDELFQLRGAQVLTGEISYDEGAHKLGVDFRPADEVSPANLQEYGIWSNPVVFDVDVNRRHLILKTPESVITCKRF